MGADAAVESSVDGGTPEASVSHPATLSDFPGVRRSPFQEEFDIQQPLLSPTVKSASEPGIVSPSHAALDIAGQAHDNLRSFCPQLSKGTHVASTMGSFNADDDTHSQMTDNLDTEYHGVNRTNDPDYFRDNDSYRSGQAMSEISSAYGMTVPRMVHSLLHSIRFAEPIRSMS